MTRQAAGRHWTSLIKVTVGTGLQRGLGALLPLGLVAIATRQAGFASAGVVGVSAAVALVVVALTDLGATPASQRDFPVGPPARREFRRLLAVRGGLAVTGAVALALGGWLVTSGDWPLALAVAAISVPPTAATALLTSKLAADGDGLTLGLGAVLGFMMGAVVGVIAGAASGDPWALLVALPVARAAECAALYAGSAFPGVSPDAPSRYGGAWLRAAWPLYAYWLIGVAYLRAQVILPRVVLGAAASGQVVDGFNLYSAATILPGALALASWPRIARAAEHSPRAATTAALRYAPISVALMAVPVGALMLWPQVATSLLFGESNDSLSAYVRWGAAATLLVGPNGLLLSLVLSLGRARAVALCYFAAFLLSAAFQLGLSKAYGVGGAGAAVFVSELLHTCWLLVLVAGVLRAPTAAPRPDTAPAAADAASPSRAHRERPRYVRPLVIGAILLGGAAAAWAAPALVFPNARTGLLLLLPLPVLVAVLIRLTRYDPFAPASIFALAWSTALAVAQLPFLPQFTWNGAMWVLVTAPPLGVVAGAVLGAGAAGRKRRPPLLGTLPRPLVPWPNVALLVAIGALSWGSYFRSIGSIPLFSSDIDVLRFSGFSLPTLIGTRLGYVGLILAVPGFLLARRRRDFLGYGACCFVGFAPLALSGGRFYAVSACAIGVAATFFLAGITRRMLIVAAFAVAFGLSAASALWFIRLDRQPPNDFRSLIQHDLVDERPFGLAATIPAQMFASISLQTLSDLVNSRAYEDVPGEGIYSTKFADRFVAGKDLEAVARDTARYEQVTSTYVGPWYADFGMNGVIILSLAWGVLNGLCYRGMAAGRNAAFLYLYAYATFFLGMAIYLNYWTLHGVWLADVPLLIALPALGAVRQWLPRRRYERGGSAYEAARFSIARRRTPRTQDAHPPLEPPDGQWAARLDEAVDGPLQG